MVRTVCWLAGLITLLMGEAGGQDCGCPWRDDERSWVCPDVNKVPTACWPLHEDIWKVELGRVPYVDTHDFWHDNLAIVNHLTFLGTGAIAEGALRPLTHLTYLDLSHDFTGGNLTRLPDLSSQTRVVSFSAGDNLLEEVPSFTHMMSLEVLDIHNNRITHLPDSFLPEKPGFLGFTMIGNGMTAINASSIVTAPPGSSLVLDETINVVWATDKEKDMLIAKNFYCNIDLIGLIQVPTNP